MDERDLSMADVATRLGVSVSTVRRWITELGLPARQLGRTIRIPRAEFEAWYKEREGSLV